MTADERAARLETRVDRLENQYREDVSAIHEKIDALITTINTGMVRAAKHECPAPGTCLSIGTVLTATVARVERLELRMLSMDTWRGWITGIGAVLIVLVTLFGPSIRAALRLE